MKPFRKLNLALAISGISLNAMCGDVFAQPALNDELDITISVIKEGETPTGFINRLQLPDFEPLNATVSSPQEIQDDDIQTEIDTASALADDTGLILTDRIVEAISIDGTTAVGGNIDVDIDADSVPVIAIPGEIVDILRPDLPLQDSLQDTLDDVDGVFRDLTPSSGTVNTLTDTVVEIDTIVDNLQPEVEQSNNALIQELVNDIPLPPAEELIAPPTDDIPAQDALDSISDELSDLPIQ